MLPVLLLALCASSAAAQWLITSKTLNQTAFQTQPYVGNGYISQRIPAEGSGFWVQEGGSNGWPLFDDRYAAAVRRTV